MKKILLLFVWTLTMLFMSKSTAQEEKLTPPTKGKAVVYFIQTESGGLTESLNYFEGETYLGKFSGRKTFRYECDPGKHTFWIRCSNIDYIEAELKADAIYLIEVQLIAVSGLLPSDAKLVIVDTSDKRQMKRIFKVVKKKELIDLNTHKIEPEVDEIYGSEKIGVTKKYIRKSLKKIKKKKERGRKVKKIIPEMEYKKQ